VVTGAGPIVGGVAPWCPTACAAPTRPKGLPRNNSGELTTRV
jgi:hypothetical protein